MNDAPTAPLTPLQRAFLALEEARARVAALEARGREPIAVIGLGLRTPGGVQDADAFWRLLTEGVDATGPIPADRWDHARYYDPDPDRPGRIATRRGGFLDRIDLFDAGFFGISPREAERMDPQQRLLLTVAYEALENAGQDPTQLEASRTGVYVGVTGSDYAYLQLESGDGGQLDAHFASGIAHSIASGRISYLLGLRGPSLTIDTACSSSLVAVHLAMQALRAGECRMALAGGVNLILAPDIFVSLSRARMLAPDGRCKAFAASANGFARAEGCGVLVLKRLADAVADRDRVLAVLQGSAVNQDGASSSLTAPNGPAQEAVIRDALANAGVAAREVGLIEAHGTGTELGDPIEAKALGAVFGTDRDAADPIMLGSVKTNIGHAEAAAGVLGVIKAVLAVQRGTVPAHLHWEEPSPHIPWSGMSLRVPRVTSPWNPSGGCRIAGVSSFGFSGTNAHVIVAEAPPVSEPAPAARPRLLALSARTADALAETARAIALRMSNEPGLELGDVARTLNVGRAHLAHRATVLAGTMREAAVALDGLAAGGAPACVRQAHVLRGDPPRIAFLFTGQGSQYPALSRGLYEACAPYRAALDRCAALLEPHLERPLTELLFSETPGLLDRTVYTQPALFAVEYALAETWRAWGVTPNVVLGHSVGEYVAATVAGVLDLADALRLIATRGRLMQSLASGGAMAAVFASEAAVLAAIADSRLPVSIAAVNGQVQTVISGAADAVEALGARLGADGVKVSRLPVSHAFHSALVEPVLAEFEREAASVRFAAPQLRLISNLTGRAASAAEVTQAGYWRDHMRQPVRFADGLAALAETKPGLCIEIGPHPALLSFAAATFGTAAPPLLPSLRRGRPDLEQILDSLGGAYLAGVAVDWRAVDPDGRVVDLPGHATRPERHWFSAAPRSGTRLPDADHRGLPGPRLRLAAGPVFQASVAIDRPAFVRQHRVQGRAVLPATAYLVGLVEAADTLLPGRPWSLKQVAIREAMLLADDGGARTVQTLCEPEHGDAFELKVLSLPEDAAESADWTLHLTARLAAEAAGPDTATVSTARAACEAEESVEAFYAGFAALGLEFGPAFRTVHRLWCGPSEALGEIVADPSGDAARSGQVDPVLLDGCLQVVAAALPAEARAHLHLPVELGHVTFTGPVRGRCFSHVTLRRAGRGLVSADIRVFDAEGASVATLTDLHLQRVDANALSRLGARWLEDCLFESAWQPAPLPARGPALPEPGALIANAAAALPALARDVDIEAHDRASAALEALCVDLTGTALRALGLSFRPGDRIREEGLADRLGVVPRHRRLLRRLLAILAEGGILEAVSDGWLVTRDPGISDTPERVRALLRSEPLIRIELGMTARVADGLADAMRGQRDASDLLFPDGATDEAERLYRDSPTARLFNGLMAEIVAGVAAARGDGRPLRILEVGAGTGGTTAHVLPRLPEDVEYTFTDVGPAFVARARERFGSRAGTAFTTFDLERDPEAQGFSGRCYDVIVASNVIHATADIGRTLARLKSLLVPGGLLVMLEVTAAQRWFDLTVGLTEGWWAFTDADLRAEYPTLAQSQWQSVLPAYGFETVATLPAVPAAAGALSRQAIFVAGAAKRSWLIFEDDDLSLARVTADLRERGDICHVVRAGPYRRDGDTTWLRPDAPGDYRRLVTDLASSGRFPDGVIHGWSLDIGADVAPAEACGRGVLGVTYLAQALLAVTPVPRVWAVTRGGQHVEEHEGPLAPFQAAVWGLGRTLALEHPELRFTCLDVDADGLKRLADELSADHAERDVAWRAGERLSACIRRMRPPQRVAADCEPWRLVPSQPGSIEEFTRVPLQRREPGPGEVEIAVAATGLNFKDVLNVLNLYPGEGGPLGAECAGTVVGVGPDVRHVVVGDPVIAVIGGAFASHVTARAELVQRRPATMGPEEGASFPIAYLTAAFCLNQVAELRAGETVLIHAAAGGVGLAAVRLALRAGATVLATAGTPAKRSLLRGLGVAHVFDSRSAAFAEETRRATDGRGVDVVLNSLGGDLVEPSFAAIADGGRFVEIGKRGIKEPAWVAAVGRSIAYTVVDWGETAARNPARIGDLFAALAADLADGHLSSLPRHLFTLDRAADAFRLMAQAGHIGRIVIGHGPSTPVLARRDGTYIVTGGLSGLGLAVGRHLVEAGAGRVVLIGRRGLTPEARDAFTAMRQSGAEIVTESVDISDADAVAQLLVRLRAGGPPLRGIVHAAGVLANRGLQQQDAGSFDSVLAPKVEGASTLDALTRIDPLDWFVLFASVAGVLGAPGQANHAAANAVLDQIAWKRRAIGLPGLSIDWGAWSEIGAAAALTDQMATRGIGFLTPQQGLAVFDRLVTGDAVAAIAAPMEWGRYRDQLGVGVHDALLGALEARPATAPIERPARPEAPAEDFRRALDEAPPARRRKMIAECVREHLLRALGMDPARPVHPQMAFGELGLDSLLSVELRNRLAATFGQSFPATLLFDYPTLDAITDFLLADDTEDPQGAAAVDGGPVPIVAGVENLSDDEVDRMLRAKFGVSV